jgi:hypothetical protein
MQLKNIIDWPNNVGPDLGLSLLQSLPWMFKGDNKYKGLTVRSGQGPDG